MAKVTLDLEEVKAKAAARLMRAARKAEANGQTERAARLTEGARFLEGRTSPEAEIGTARQA